MNKIFNQELKFKDSKGNDYPEWEEKKLGEIYKFSQGLQVDLENQFFEKTSTRERFIRIIDITQNNQEVRYVEKISDNYMVDEEDIFMVRYGAIGFVGYGYKGIIANNLFKLIEITNKTYSKFFYFQLNSIKIQNNLLQLSASTSMPALNFKSVSNILVVVPYLEEQQKIADFLSSIDDKIEKLSSKLEELKEFKKGLLQQMFV